MADTTTRRRRRRDDAEEEAEARAPVAAPAKETVFGQRVPVRTEYTGISEHPSTRVHAAPGGRSSISLA